MKGHKRNGEYFELGSQGLPSESCTLLLLSWVEQCVYMLTTCCWLEANQMWRSCWAASGSKNTPRSTSCKGYGICEDACSFRRAGVNDNYINYVKKLVGLWNLHAQKGTPAKPLSGAESSLDA